MKILEVRIGRCDKGRRYARHELRSRVSRLDPVQNLGILTVAFHRGHQYGFLSIRMRKEDVSNAKF